MVMNICLELGKEEDEIAHWTLDQLCKWQGFFRLRNKLEAEAIAKARNSAPTPGKQVTIF